jgi:hypothetical protein
MVGPLVKVLITILAVSSDLLLERDSGRKKGVYRVKPHKNRFICQFIKLTREFDSERSRSANIVISTFPNVAEKNILILVEGKKKSDSEFLSYNLMLNAGKKNCALRIKKHVKKLNFFF